VRFLDIYENVDPRTRRRVSALVVIQSDQAVRLDTVLIAPAYRPEQSEDLGHLTPIIEADAVRFRVMVPELAAAPRAILKGRRIGSALAYRDALVRALDLLVLGN
jgi:hypothetical protein